MQTLVNYIQLVSFGIMILFLIGFLCYKIYLKQKRKREHYYDILEKIWDLENRQQNMNLMLKKITKSMFPKKK